MTDIEGAVNIGPTLGAELRRAGIATIEDLRALGYVEAWRRLHAVSPGRDCVHSCLALAGAIEGTRWTRLPRERRMTIIARVRGNTTAEAFQAASGPEE